jgi:hypothetical protein
MSSTLKVLVPIVLLIAVVFAVTYFSTTIPRDDSEKKVKQADTGERPLRFFSSIRKWEPPYSLFDKKHGDGAESPVAVNLLNTLFPGTFEPDELKTRHAPFWFVNPNKGSVTMRLERVGCMSCTGGRLAPIPTDVTRALLQMSAVSLLPQGLVSTLPVGVAGPAAHLGNLPWTTFGLFNEPDKVVFKVPAAGDDPWGPQWGILELTFVVRPGTTAKPVQASFRSVVEGTTQSATDEFTVYYAPVNPIEVDTPIIDVGTLTETSPVQERSFIVASPTRTVEELDGLKVDVRTPGGASDLHPFVSVGKPVPLVGADYDAFAAKVSAQAGGKARVMGALRVPVTIRTRIGETRADIGSLDREVWLNLGTGEPKYVLIKANVRGPIYLTDERDINLGSFDGKQGVSQAFSVTVERPDLELAVVPDQSVPKFLQVSLEKEADRNARRYYKVRVAVPKNEQFGEIAGGVIVLETKGPNPQRVRFAVRGRGER